LNKATSEVLRLLREGSGFVSGEYMSSRLGISRTAVWKHVKKLRRSGYSIEAIPRNGYRLRYSPDLPSELEIRPWLETETLGCRIVFREEVESTNDLASELAGEGEPEGLVVIADQQSAGKGRMDRRWISPPGQNLYLSVVLRPAVSPWQAPQMAIVVVTAVVRTIEALAEGIRLGIKWPNDVVCNGRKLAGILCELSSDLDMVHYLVAGIGINVNMKDLDGELEGRATSLLEETGKEHSRPQMAGRLLNELERSYSRWLEQGLSGFIPFWEDRSVLTGKTVVIETPSGNLTGRAIRLSPSGGLEIERPDGSVMEVLSGDVHISSISD
jgi:BirA family biotin operon repressor/biotin-[acetyl-CoA-carboxylase] ligase